MGYTPRHAGGSVWRPAPHVPPAFPYIRLCARVDDKGGKRIMAIFRVAVEGFINGTDMTRNVFTFSSEAGLPSDTNLTAYFNDLWSTEMKDTISSRWVTSRYIIEEPDAGGHWVYNHEVPWVIAGVNAADALPNQMAAVVVGVTASRRRGKKFIYGITEAGQVGGVLASSPLFVLGQFATKYAAGITVGGVSALAGVCKPDGTNFLEFTSARVNQIMGTQRRRKQGVGR